MHLAPVREADPAEAEGRHDLGQQGAQRRWAQGVQLHLDRYATTGEGTGSGRDQGSAGSYPATTNRQAAVAAAVASSSLRALR